MKTRKPISERFGTTVVNPTRRPGEAGYRECRWCKKLYTKLGLSRHWDKCSVKKEQSNAH